MEPISVFKRAIDQTGQIVANVKPEQLGDSTPCDDWDVRALVNHTIAVAIAFSGGVRGEEFDFSPFAEDNVGNDAAAGYAKAAAELHTGLEAPGLLDRTWNMPFGAVPGAIAIGFCTLELSQHGWDIAKATGQKVDFDDEVSQVAMATAQAAPAEQVRNPVVFGPEADCPESAPLADRVAAFVGRKV